MPPYDSLYVSINLVTSPTGSTTSAEKEKKKNKNNNNTEILSTDKPQGLNRTNLIKNKMHQN